MRQLFPLLLAATLSHSVAAQTVDVQDAWVRPSVKGQMATGAFMKLTAKETASLVGAASPAAGVVEVHEMSMDGGVMKMRAIPALALPAGQAVELKPGGYHVMLMDLKGPLTAGSKLPLTLVLRDAKGVEKKMELQVNVGMPMGAKAPAMGAQGDHKH